MICTGTMAQSTLTCVVAAGPHDLPQSTDEASVGGGGTNGGTNGGANGTGGGLQTVSISFLQSYEHMGMARVQCDSGCTCRPSTMNGHTGHHTSMLAMHSFLATQHAECVVSITILPVRGGSERAAAARPSSGLPPELSCAA